MPSKKVPQIQPYTTVSFTECPMEVAPTSDPHLLNFVAACMYNQGHGMSLYHIANNDVCHSNLLILLDQFSGGTRYVSSVQVWSRASYSEGSWCYIIV